MKERGGRGGRRRQEIIAIVQLLLNPEVDSTSLRIRSGECSSHWLAFHSSRTRSRRDGDGDGDDYDYDDDVDVDDGRERQTNAHRSTLTETGGARCRGYPPTEESSRVDPNRCICT